MKVAVGESADQGDTQSVCAVRTIVKQLTRFQLI